MKARGKIVVVILLVAAVLALGSCSVIDQGIVGRWGSSESIWDFELGADGSVTFNEDSLFGALMILGTLGGQAEYSASNGAGEWWYYALFVKSDSSAFTYTFEGNTLVSDIFADEQQVWYKH
ncbi:hypothetical protein [Spirochaeta lutea]|uniref:DUF5640 domain-containing protein n=1 Tax=Spirochaeta lutea TaxID=1480694 RepID=A0A098QUK4_9SPIO|nr:hypothetical protein [Spirochaeta lutea]KGE71540.1 hypothetical protein DC28_09580 [Spirochaeta lutea]